MLSKSKIENILNKKLLTESRKIVLNDSIILIFLYSIEFFENFLADDVETSMSNGVFLPRK